MTGEEHYRLAELLIEAVSKPNQLAPNPVIRNDRPEFIAAAQVHATLAVAAALAPAATTTAGTAGAGGEAPGEADTGTGEALFADAREGLEPSPEGGRRRRNVRKIGEGQ